MDTRIKFLYLSEPDMIKAGVKNMDQCVEAMEDLLVTLNKGDYVMAGVNHNSHGAQVIFQMIRSLRECRKCRRPPVYGDAGISWRKIPDGRNEVVWK